MRGSDNTEWVYNYLTVEDSELDSVLEELLRTELSDYGIVRGVEGGYDTYTNDDGLFVKVTVFRGEYAEEDMLHHKMEYGY